MILELHRAVSNITKTKSFDDHLSPADKAKMQLEIATLIFRGVPLATVASVVNAVITAIVAWNMVNHLVLGAWVAGISILALLRIGLWYSVKRQRPTLTVMSRFKKLNLIGMMVNGALWGMLAPIFAVYGQIGHVFLPFILAGMTAASIVSAGACWRCVMAFNVPALLPMAATFFIWGGSGATLISAAIILYGVLTSILALQTSNMINRALFLRSRNTHLTQVLESKVDEKNEAGKRFQALIESSRELTLIFSPEGTVTYASPVSEEILGMKPGQIQGMTTRELMHEDDLPQFRAAGEQALSVLGEVRILPHICLKSESGNFVPMSGRISNFLYVPGVEGFAFTGSPQKPEMASRLHAAE